MGTEVIVKVTVNPDGRASDCSVFRASPDPEADRITCRLVVDRLRRQRTLTFRAQPPTNMVFGPNWYVETSNYMEAKMVNEALGWEIYVGPTE